MFWDSRGVVLTDVLHRGAITANAYYQPQVDREKAAIDKAVSCLTNVLKTNEHRFSSDNDDIRNGINSLSRLKST